MSYNIEVTPASKNAWFTPEESNGYYKARYAREGVTIHWWGGGEQEDKHDSIVQYFLKQAELGIKSTNYVVSDAKITQMVDPDNVAWCSNAGNPTTISIECEPGLSDEGYKKLAWLIKTLEAKYGHPLSVYKHSDWVATACPGTIDVERIKREKDGVTSGTVPTTPAPAPQPVPTPSGKQTVYLPSYVETWAAYRPYSGYVKGSSDQVGTLLPKQYGGLTYEVLERDGNAVIIQTQMLGKVAIWVQGTEAVIRDARNYVPQAVPKPAPTGQTVTFPPHVDTWAVYRVGSQYRKGTSDQVGTLLPKYFGGLTYPVIQNLGNVVVIDTQNFGRVAAWVQDTDAIIK